MARLLARDPWGDAIALTFLGPAGVRFQEIVMIVLLLVLMLMPTVAFAQERVIVLRNKEGKVTGTIRSSGPRPTNGLAILCAHGRCEPPPPAVDESMPTLIPIRASRSHDGGPQLLPGPRFTNFVGPSPSTVSIPLPYPTVRIIQ